MLTSRLRTRALGIDFPILCGSLFCASAYAQRVALEANTKDGRVRGVVADGVAAYKGIPFAQRRFRKVCFRRRSSNRAEAAGFFRRAS
jgi:hypothetical protein